MVMSRKNQGNGSLGDFIIELFHFFTRICYFGVKNINFKSFETWCISLITASFLGAIPLGPINYLKSSVSAVSPSLPFYWKIFFNMSPFIQYTVLLSLLGIITLFFFGFRDFRRHVVFQTAIDCTSLKNSKGKVPKENIALKCWSRSCYRYNSRFSYKAKIRERE